MSEKEIFANSTIKDELDLKRCMTQIEFGYVDIDENVHYEIDQDFRDNFSLQAPRTLMKSFVGTCFDEVELIRRFFKEKEIYAETYFVISKGAGTVQNHAFVVFQNDNMWGWFENYWKEYEGIHYYVSKERLLKDVYNKFLSKCGRVSTIALYQYDRPEYGINYNEFIEHCMQGRLAYSNKKERDVERPKIASIFMAKGINGDEESLDE
ncbi:MAG: hypothetical protein MJ245_01320 [Clostridia bacterium]|nr:hypothetical protein [Clostridia bacterium]